MTKNKRIVVHGTEIVIFKDREEDFISLTDIARYRDPERSDYILQNWMRNRSTIEFIGLWEQFNNPGFNSIEFDGIKNMAGSNSFRLHQNDGLNLLAQEVSFLRQDVMAAHLPTRTLHLSLLPG